MTTGRHQVRGLYCLSCNWLLGWRYGERRWGGGSWGGDILSMGAGPEATAGLAGWCARLQSRQPGQQALSKSIGVAQHPGAQPLLPQLLLSWCGLGVSAAAGEAGCQPSAGNCGTDCGRECTGVNAAPNKYRACARGSHESDLAQGEDQPGGTRAKYSLPNRCCAAITRCAANRCCTRFPAVAEFAEEQREKYKASRSAAPAADCGFCARLCAGWQGWRGCCTAAVTWQRLTMAAQGTPVQLEHVPL